MTNIPVQDCLGAKSALGSKDDMLSQTGIRPSAVPTSGLRGHDNDMLLVHALKGSLHHTWSTNSVGGPGQFELGHSPQANRDQFQTPRARLDSQHKYVS